jgi:selenocysteine-specific elongation factor
VSLAADQEGLRAALLKAHAAAGLAPPNLKEVLEALDVTPKAAAPVLRLLCESGELVKIKEGLCYHGPALTEIMERVRQWFADHDNLDVAGLKELTGLSRKYLIALLEYMDNARITVRVGDQRRYRGR